MRAERRGGVWWWGPVPVPTTAMWTAEIDQGYVAACVHAAGRPALMAPERTGQGEPRFKMPHPLRQRRAAVLGLCDICGKSLRTKTKYLCGNVRAGPGLPRAASSEPLVCGGCLPLASRHCPFVRREVAAGTRPLVVTRYDLAWSIVNKEGLELSVGLGLFPEEGAICFAKIVPLALRHPLALRA